MNQTDIHTVLIGTSKTEPDSEYYCKGSNVSKFWETLSTRHKSFNGNQPETEKLLNKGVRITDISGAAPGKEKSDKSIMAGTLQEGFVNLESHLKQNGQIKRIGFIGKQAVQWFFFYFLRNIELGESSSGLLKSDLFSYGKQDWSLVIKGRSIVCFVLPNTGHHWNKKEWELFWETVL